MGVLRMGLCPCLKGSLQHLLRLRRPGCKATGATRVQQILPPEAREAGGPAVRTIVDPFRPLGGIESPFPVIEGVW